MIEIDGSYGEGGGSIIRLAAAFSAITKKPVYIKNIRKERKQPGLKEQHLKGVIAVKNICNAELEGARLGSTEIKFIPKDITKTYLKVDIRTSGSIGLLIQCILLPCFFSKQKTTIEIKGGGTVGLNAPHIYYIKNIFLEMIKRFGFNAEIEIKKHGFYPKGGADVFLKTQPIVKKNKIEIDETGKLLFVKGIVLVSDTLKKADVAERMRKAASHILLKKLKICPEIKVEYCKTLSTGASMVLWAEFENTIIGWDIIGEKGICAEDIGKKVAEGLLKQIESGAVVDEYMSDQLLPYLAICGGIFNSSKLTKHAETNIWLIKEIFEKRIKIKKDKNVSFYLEN